MFFQRKKKVVIKEPRVDADKVIIGAARTVGTVVGTASGAYEIGRKSAAEAKDIDTDGMKKTAREKKELAAAKAKEIGKKATKQADKTKKIASKQAEETKKMATKRADETKKMVTAKAKEAQAVAMDKVDDLREAAADKIAPKKKRGLFGR